MNDLISGGTDSITGKQKIQQKNKNKTDYEIQHVYICPM